MGRAVRLARFIRDQQGSFGTNRVSVLWNLPISLLANPVVGVSQHQLAGATHEAAHHFLLKNH